MNTGEFLLNFYFLSFNSESFLNTSAFMASEYRWLKFLANDPNKMTMSSGIRKHFLLLQKLLNFTELQFSHHYNGHKRITSLKL